MFLCLLAVNAIPIHDFRDGQLARNSLQQQDDVNYEVSFQHGFNSPLNYIFFAQFLWYFLFISILKVQTKCFWKAKKFFI